MLKGTHHSPESIKIMVKNHWSKKPGFPGFPMKGKKFSEEVRAHMRDAAPFRRPHSEESRRRQGEAMSRRLLDKSKNSMYGRKHSEESILKMRKVHSGALNHNWKGGINHHSQGYICQSAPGHPFRIGGGGGYVLQHRLVAESILKRFLNPSECVHHINKIRNDNRPENLMVYVNRGVHLRQQMGFEPKPEETVFDGSKFHATESRFPDVKD
jgi:hypothetical protein